MFLRMKITQKPTFKRAYKKLHPNQCAAVNQAIKEILKDPEVGGGKSGDLAGVKVFKFDCVKRLYLLAYTVSEDQLDLLSLGPHENFYQKLKR
ncbi:MAG: type II toxin-antitoxin system RelE/ParE family toxin [Gammaproteobacteria bacterium]|nr:type II toxin-antitoxin system RelE/ParE family toxin [Gammaproteobacteria bacterium]MBT4606534.1 type II toxin-antitoxin system RelE/ParE family toxin [Thiotrichales bacterium]MBT5465331.1 type II toxin-antitoxin system RelE/ParE family toxin [Candidatus Neomarinimicrobiota bacterium]MBT4329739.1 type II toxin-antitoxin system RelE/ParE family toxin [Gammaproteobacteria bacterium]MBT5370189.1 type II toxin-antitoxin system RelE/ParE family toxin [Gammaproteobacteria bacterium]